MDGGRDVAVVLVAAVLVPLGVLVAVAEGLATGSYILLAPWEPLDRPWTLAPWAALLLAAALATRRSGTWSVARWDLPSFFVAHGVAALALVVAADSGGPAPTFALFAGLSVLIAGVLRRWPWAVAGAVLLLVAGVDAGSGWLALVLLAEGIACTVAGLQQLRAVRWVLVALGAISLVGAWFELAVWQSWSVATVYYVTVPAAALVALTAAFGVCWVRRVRVPVQLAGVWAIAGGVVTVGTGLVGSDDVARRPGGLLLAGSLVVLAVAAGVTAVVVGAWMRWLAAGVASVAWTPAAWAVEVSATAATMTGTAVGLGGVLVALAAQRGRRGTVWLGPATFYAAATQVAAAVAAVSAFPDHDLIRLVLLAVAVELVVLAVLTGRRELHLVSPLPALGAWGFHLGDAVAGTSDWWGFYAMMPAAAVVALVAAAGVRGVRWVRVPIELAGGWAVAGAAVAVATGLTGVGEVPRLPGGLLFAGSLLVLATAAAVTAAVFGVSMRWVSAAVAAMAWVPAAWAVEMSETVAALTGTGIGLLGLGTVLAVHGFRPRSIWVGPGAFFAVATQLGAAGAAISVLPDTGLLIVVLLAAAVELVALGVLADRPECYVLAPAPALGAWLLFARASLAGDPSWFTVPIGLAVLVMVGLVRWIRRGRGGDPAGYDIVAVEFVGMSFLVGAAVARTLGGHLWNGVLLIGIGVLAATWGAVTQVRRRAAFGAASVVLAIVLLIGVPLTESVTWRGPTLWLTLSVIGITAIVVASALEQGRERVRDVARRLDRMTAGWERVELRPSRDAVGNTDAVDPESGAGHAADLAPPAVEAAEQRHEQSV